MRPPTVARGGASAYTLGRPGAAPETLGICRVRRREVPPYADIAASTIGRVEEPLWPEERFTPNSS